MTWPLLAVLGVALALALAWGWQLYQNWRERRDDAALSRALRNPERWDSEPTNPEKDAAERAALRQRLKGDR